VADLFMPVFSGHLVDALTRGAEDPRTRRHAAISASGNSSRSASLDRAAMTGWQGESCRSR